ncbi:MAG: hypothetical protein DMF93_16325 [Acidobacteria bacterium]|nr:MAG: hypothetical protein DMF93_16325 [Acidobacteriota bacterium]
MRLGTIGPTVVLAALAIGDPVAQTVTVSAGGDLQDALNRARPGDTILLQRGATFVGNYTLPAKEGGDRPITLRTAGDDGFPPEGERMSPLAGDALAKVRSANGASALVTAPGARNWRIALVEFLANRDGAGDIIALGDGGTAQNSLTTVPSNLTLDRLYVHGDPDRGQKRAVALNSGQTTIVGCYISDIKAIGQDSQAIAGWNGPGPYTIENNYLEAASENIMFGGADPSILELTPSRIVVRNNVLSKPLAWKDPGAPPWQVKNLFELKNARGVLVERNVMERTWQQAQSGYAVLFTVRNQDGACPWCQVEDVEFRFNVVRDVAAAVQVLGTDPNFPSRQTNNIRIHDNVFDGIDRDAWGGDGYFALLSDAPRDVAIDHNTIIQRASGGVVKIAHGVATDFRFTNNIAAHGDYGIIGTDHGVGNDSISAYLPGARIANNVLAGGNRSAYPGGNLFPSMDEFRKQFVGFGSHDYRLVPRSAWLGAGTDGRDLGADLALVVDAARARGAPVRATRPPARGIGD